MAVTGLCLPIGACDFVKITTLSVSRPKSQPSEVAVYATVDCNSPVTPFGTGAERRYFCRPSDMRDARTERDGEEAITIPKQAKTHPMAVLAPNGSFGLNFIHASSCAQTS